MQMRTHFFVGLAASAYLSYFLQVTLWDKALWLAVAPVFGLVALAPDFLDRYPSQKLGQIAVAFHSRHPLTHSPWTISYFIALSLLLPSKPEYSFLILQLGVAWSTHLLIDALNPSGLPLLFTPALENEEAKYYSHKKVNRGTKRLVLGNINYNNHFWNQGFTFTAVLVFLAITGALLLDIVVQLEIL